MPATQTDHPAPFGAAPAPRETPSPVIPAGLAAAIARCYLNPDRSTKR